jgi:hypothetical protein
MQCISIQIQPEFLGEFDRKKFLAQVRSVGRSPEIDEFNEKGKNFLNYNFFTEKPRKLWQDLQSALYKNPDYSAVISPVSIAVFEDEDEDNPMGFIVLHHFDSTEKIDTL